MYTKDQLKYIMDELSDHIWYFGYANQEDNNRTAFFNYEKPTPEQKSLYRGFRKDNEQAITSAVETKNLPRCKYLINGGVEGADVTTRVPKEDMKMM